MNYVRQTLSKIFSWLLPFQTEIRQLRNLIVLQKNKKIINRKNPYLVFGYHIRSLNESLCTLFCIFFQLIYNIFLCAAQTWHKIWFTIILPFGRDNVLCPITSFSPKVKKNESSTIFALGYTTCFSTSITYSSNLNSNGIRCRSSLLKSTKKLLFFLSVIYYVCNHNFNERHVRQGIASVNI